MSYCRWSSDDHQCDVYVYESVGDFFAIHVAGNRVTPPAETRPAPLEPADWWNHGEAGLAAFMARDAAVEAWLATGERKAIGLPHDGESFEEPSAGACADRLEALRAAGYNVPQHAIDALREEAAEGSGEA